MKKRSFSLNTRASGILRLSTLCILAGGAAGLTSCERSTHVATEEDAQMAAIQTRIETLDQEKSRLMAGEVSNNFNIPRVGYYHAGTGSFFEHPYNFQQNGRYYVNGQWQLTQGPESVPASRPSKEALEQVDAALAEEQKLASGPEATGSNQHGFGMGNALMMFWLLSGNRGMFSPGAGFRQANSQAPAWQRGVENQRGAVGRYASANPGYQKMVQQARASGTPVSPGQSVRGGFGSSKSGSGYSSFGG